LLHKYKYNNPKILGCGLGAKSVVWCIASCLFLSLCRRE